MSNHFNIGPFSVRWLADRRFSSVKEDLSKHVPINTFVSKDGIGIIQFLVPGYTKHDISISVRYSPTTRTNVLVVSGNAPLLVDDDTANRVSTGFVLPKQFKTEVSLNATAEVVSAVVKDGILSVSIRNFDSDDEDKVTSIPVQD